MKIRSLVKAALMTFFAAVMMTGCSPKQVEETVDIYYGESYTIENEDLAKYENIVWSSDNEEVAAPENNVVTGKNPGTAVITGVSNDKTVALYTVNVKLVDITGIVLSTNNLTLKVDEGFQLSYSLFPDNATDYGITWKSADETVAGINDEGYILALKAGQTTISASNPSGIMATCSVTVEEKAAYERLRTYEKEFVDLFLKYVDDFKNPSSLSVTKIYRMVGDDGDVTWVIDVNGTNSYGGYVTSSYFLDNEYGFMENSTGVNLSNPDYDLDLINQAIQEKVP
ncbi:MAG: Ig-like domain-containing protein [Ruminococcus sp.]|nr:Ig-like domain-containing protein [Ruminococcus sp.]